MAREGEMTATAVNVVFAVLLAQYLNRMRAKILASGAGIRVLWRAVDQRKQLARVSNGRFPDESAAYVASWLLSCKSRGPL